MTKILRRTSAFAACLLLVFSMACSKIDKSHFDKLKNGQTVEEVKGILGEPTSGADKGVDIGGFTGAFVWQEGDKKITVMFLMGKAQLISKDGF